VTWQDLFDRAEGVETTVAAIRAELDRQREDADE